MDKRELFSWATSVGAGLPVAALMIHEMFVFAAVVSVLLAVGGIALMSWPERRRDCHWAVGESKLDSSDVFTTRAGRT
jgi:hypothetical protein